MYAGEHRHDNEDERAHEQLADRFPLPTIPSPPGSSISSLSSQDSLAAHVHPPTPDMDESADGYRRRRAGLIGRDDGRARGYPGPEGSPSSHRRLKSNRSNDEASDNHMVDSSEDRRGSDFSALPIIENIENVELEHYPSEGGISDDEEIGLAKNDKQRRNRRRARTATLIGDSPGSIKIAEQEQKLADRNVVRALIINALLIASWYLFSVSISVVGQQKAFLLISTNAKPTFPVQQMDVLSRKSRLPLSTLHNVHAHGCPVLTSFACTIFHTTSSPSIGQYNESSKSSLYP